MRISVYTVIVNNYDNLRPIPSTAIISNARYICFSDRPRKVQAWEIQPFPQIISDQHRLSRIPKMLPHLLIPGTEFSIYMDGAFTLCGSPQEMVVNLLGDADVALFQHPTNNNIHDERNFYQKLHGYVPEDVETEYRKYCELGLAESAGFWAGGFMIRRHSPAVEKFNEIWMRRFLAGSYNDQFSLAVALTEVIKSDGLKVRSLPDYYACGRRLAYNFHARSGDPSNLAFVGENAEWVSRIDKIREIVASV